MKVPEPRKLDSGSYFIQLRLNGVSVPVTASTAKECKRQAELIKAEHRAGKRQITKANDITLSQAIDKYVDSKNIKLSPATKRGYNTIKNNNFAEDMDKPIKSVNWQKACDKEAIKYSAKTLKNAWGLASSAMQFCGYMPPKVALPQVVVEDEPWLEPDEIQTFVNYIKDKPCAIPAMLALHSLRRSEICALTWEKIDLDKNLIKIEGAAVFDEHQKLVQKPTNKNKTSRRIVPIMIPELITALGDAKEKSGLVVTCNPNTIWAQINRACDVCKLPRVGVHGLRRSFASLAYHLGWTERQTMETGGWADSATMHKHYVKLAAVDRAKAQNNMLDFYKNANENANKLEKTLENQAV